MEVGQGMVMDSIIVWAEVVSPWEREDVWMDNPLKDTESIANNSSTTIPMPAMILEDSSEMKMEMGISHETMMMRISV